MESQETPKVKSRAYRLKDRWIMYNKMHKAGKPSTLNFGRMRLSEFIRYQYRDYVKLCFFCMEKPLTLSKWLMVKTPDMTFTPSD